jgi:hypothetical protein
MDELPIQSLAAAFRHLWLEDIATRDLWDNRIDWGLIPEVDELDTKPDFLIKRTLLSPTYDDEELNELNEVDELDEPTKFIDAPPKRVIMPLNNLIKTVITRNLPRDITVTQLRCVFEKYGPVRDIYIPKNMDKSSPYFGTIKGFALIKFLNPDHSAAAYADLVGRFTIGTNLITIEFAKEDR